MFRWGVTDPAHVLYRIDIPKQNLNYHLKKWCDEGILEKKERGIYKITDSGKKYHDEYETLKNKRRIRLENLRVKFRIHTNLDKIFGETKWKKVPMKNNVIHYHGKLYGHTAKLITSEKNAFLEITSKHCFNENAAEVYFQARLQIQNVIGDLAQKYDINFGHPIISSRPQYAWASPISESLLECTGAGEIRTQNASFNRSKGRCADIEPTSLEHAEKILEMPYHIENVEEDLVILKNTTKGIQKLLGKTSWSPWNPNGFNQFF